MYSSIFFHNLNFYELCKYIIPFNYMNLKELISKIQFILKKK